MNTSEFLTKLEEIYHKYFPHSAVKYRVRSSLYRSIFISFYLAGDASENSGGYWDNDMFFARFQIDDNGNELPEGYDNELPEEITLNAIRKSYHVKPESKYYAYSRRKLTFRKTTGTPEKILQTLEKFIKRLKESVEKDLTESNIHKNHIELVEEKLGKSRTAEQVLNYLMEDAERGAEYRGHTIIWEDQKYPNSRFGECEKCGRGVSVRANPMPNEIDISGEAVAVNCR